MKRFDDAIYKMAGKVTDFLFELCKQDNTPESKGIHVPGGMPQDDFAYGQALVHWESKGRPKPAWFSTPDPYLLAMSKELTEEFGLPVVTVEDGKKLEERYSKVKQEVVDGTGKNYTGKEKNDTIKFIQSDEYKKMWN